MTTKFENLLELLINEENEKAEALFHEIVVEKSRDIYEGLADEETKADAKQEDKKEETKEAKDEAKEDDKKEEVKETEKSDETKDEKAVDETKEDKPAEEKIKDEGVFTKPAPTQTQVQAPVEKTDEESIEEIGGDATDELIKDISSDEEGEGDKAADDMEVAMDPDAENGENGEEGSVEDRVVDLEDALDEQKAEFEAMMAGQNGDEEAEETALAPVIPAQETQPEISRFESKKAEAKETVKEYAIKKSADTKDHADKSAKSPVSSGPKVKSSATPVKTGSGAEEKGRAAPTAKKIEGGFENSPGKDKSTSYKKEEKADLKDGSDKSAKSPVAKAK